MGRGPSKPPIAKYAFAPYLSNLAANISAYTNGCHTRNGAPKHAEKVASGSWCGDVADTVTSPRPMLCMLGAHGRALLRYSMRVHGTEGTIAVTIGRKTQNMKGGREHLH